MVIREFVVRIAMLRADDTGNAGMAAGSAIGFHFNPMSQAARNVPSGGRSYRRGWTGGDASPCGATRTWIEGGCLTDRIQRGIGPYVFDVDGNRYVDFIGS